MIQRRKDPTPEHGDPGDENDYSYDASILVDAIEWARNSPPSWWVELMEYYAKRHFGKK